MKRFIANLALLLGISLIVAPVAMTQTQNPYVLTATKIATALGYTPADSSLYCALAGCTFSTNANNTVKFGGSTSSFPAIGRNGSHFTATLADSSDYTIVDAGIYNSRPQIALTSGGSTVFGFCASTTNQCILFGKDAPTISASQGSIYVRANGTTVNDRLYINSSNGSGTTWVAVTTAG